jgi:hypothetical protein
MPRFGGAFHVDWNRDAELARQSRGLWSLRSSRILSARRMDRTTVLLFDPFVRRAPRLHVPSVQYRASTYPDQCKDCYEQHREQGDERRRRVDIPGPPNVIVMAGDLDGVARDRLDQSGQHDCCKRRLWSSSPDQYTDPT